MFKCRFARLGGATRKTGKEREGAISVGEATTTTTMMIDKPTTRARGRLRDLPGIRQVADG